MQVLLSQGKDVVFTHIGPRLTVKSCTKMAIVSRKQGGPCLIMASIGIVEFPPDSIIRVRPDFLRACIAGRILVGKTRPAAIPVKDRGAGDRMGPV